MGGALVTPGPSLLTVRSLAVDAGRRRLVHSIDFELEAGEWKALVGPNGAGKTTLLKAVAGLVPFEGEVLIRGAKVASDPVGFRRQIGVVMHEPLVYREMSAYENLLFYARLYGLDRPGERAAEGLAAVGLGPYRHEAVGRFSRGMLQRLAVARALLHEPSLLLLDEPLSGVDAAGEKELLALFRSAKERGAAALWVTHRWERAWALVDELLELQAGRLVRATRTAGEAREAWRPLHAGEGERRE